MLSVSLLACSAFKKRPYLQDLKPFGEFYSPKNVTTIFAASSLVPFNKIIYEFNIHMENTPDEEFPWESKISHQLPLFYSSLRRNVVVSFIKKILEMFAVQSLPARIADKLTKDVSLSIVRKCARFSRFEACQRIVSTGIWNSIPLNVSYLIFDVTATIVESVNELVNRKQNALSLQSIRTKFLYIFKKIGYYALCGLSSSIGYGLGCYFNIAYAGPIMKLLFEFGAAVPYSILFAIN